MDQTSMILAALGEAACVIEDSYDLRYVNPTMVERFGEPGARKCYEYIGGRSEPCAQCPMSLALAGQTVREEWRCPADGKVYDVCAAPLQFQGERPAALVVLHDISRLKQAEQSVAKLNRILTTLSDTDEMIMRTSDRQQLFEEVCKIAVTRGGFLLASIGIVEDGAIRIRAAARRIDGNEAADHLPLARDDRPGWDGPTGKAISTGQPRICNDLATDPDVAGWRDQLVSRGFGAFAAFPIFVDGEAIGALRLHESATGFFGEDEIRLLGEMAADISVALGSLGRAEAVRESEERYRFLFDTMLEGFGYHRLIRDDEGRAVDWIYLAVNDAFVRLTGLRDVIGKRVTEAIPGIRETSPELFEIYGRVAATGQAETFETFFEPLGLWLTIAVTSPDREHFLVAFEDITESKQAELALRDSETRYHAIFEQTSMGIVLTGLDTIHLDANSAFLDMLGLTKDEFLTMGRWDFTHPDERDPDPMLWHELEAGTRTSYQRETRYLHKDGRTVWVRLTVSFALNADGERVAVIAATEDITERKQAEERLRESEQRYRDLVETTSDWVWEVDASGVYTYASAAVQSILGYAPEEVLGRKLCDFMPPEEAARVEALFETITPRRQPFARFENVNRHADGHLVVLESNGVPIIDAAGEFHGYRGMGHDITKRRRAEEALRQSLALRDRIIATSMDAFFILAPGGVLEEANEAFAQMLGYSRDELLKMKISDVDVIESPDDVEAHLQQIAAQGSDRFEIKHRRKDGVILDVEISSVHVDTEHGPRFAVFARDITDRKQAEARQVRLVALLRAVVSMTDELIDAPDVDTLCLRAVEMARDQLGLERASIHLLEGEELRGTYGTDSQRRTTEEKQHRFMPSARMATLMRRAGDHNQPWHARTGPLVEYVDHEQRKVTEGWIAETPIHADRDPVGMFSNDTAITGRELEPEQQEAVAILCSLLGHMIKNKRADERVAESEGRYRSLFESSPVAIIEADFSAVHEHIQALRLQGMADPGAYLDLHPEALPQLIAEVKVVALNRAVLELHRAKSRQQFLAAFAVTRSAGVNGAMRELFIAAASGRASVDTEGTGKTVDGDDIQVALRAQVVPGHEDDLSRVLVSALDITARKKAEDALLQSMAKYRSVFENSAAAMVVYDENGIVRLCNSNFETLSGLPWAEIEGKLDWWGFVSLDDLNAVLDRHAEAVQSGKPAELEFRIASLDGTVRDVLARVSLIPDSTDCIASLLDITDRKHAADAQRLAAIGQLAAGVAHDFNNLLAAMSMSAELADISGDLRDYEKAVEIVLRSSQRGADLCRNLMAFARPRQPRREPVYLEAVAEAALLVVARQLETTGATVRRDYEPDSHRIMADPGQLEQVFLNLFINACHAMPTGGQLSIETRYRARSPHDGGAVTVTVRDTGSGIQPEHLGRLFEPFFTTKGRLGESDTPGTGLGLSVSHGIVQAHEGTVRVSSELGVGTAFELTFPLRAPGDEVPAGEAPEGASEPETAAVGNAHVLVVDDEEDIRAVVRAALVRAGMRVTALPHPDVAIAALRSNAFDLVVTDLSMPGGGGKAVLEAVRALEAPPPVIVMTGRLGSYVVDELLALGAAECLQKPVTRDVVLGAVARALESAK